MFTRTRAQHDFELKPAPVETFGRLANISEEIGVGNIPKFITDAKKGGRKRWRKEREHIAFGKFYHEIAKRGEIDDAAPTKTIASLFGVSPRAVQKWVERWDEICLGVPFHHLTPEQIEKNARMRWQPVQVRWAGV